MLLFEKQEPSAATGFRGCIDALEARCSSNYDHFSQRSISKLEDHTGEQHAERQALVRPVPAVSHQKC